MIMTQAPLEKTKKEAEKLSLFLSKLQFDITEKISH